jgi:hypothetical protein
MFQGNVKAKYQLAQQVMKRYGANRPTEPHNRAITLLQVCAPVFSSLCSFRLEKYLFTFIFSMLIQLVFLALFLSLLSFSFNALFLSVFLILYPSLFQPLPFSLSLCSLCSLRSLSVTQEAAASHFLPAIFTLGAYYELGLGVEKNLERARLHHEDAARLGFPQSMVEAGIFYEQVSDDSFPGLDLISRFFM